MKINLKKMKNIPTRLPKSFLYKYRLPNIDFDSDIVSESNIYNNQEISSSSSNKTYSPSNENINKNYKTPVSSKESKNKSFMTNNSSNKRPYSYKKALCKFFIKNACTKGEECTYSHEVKAFPCHAYHLRDNCTRKNCKFSHLPITIEQLRELKKEEKEEFTFSSLFGENDNLV
ncbi:hypothetical protein H312_01951 [Anncaliia algerae PRA339]|uniref:C3H1-type domain-containing protein n=1 Tax=Anncaliia algerae PRA339 TaxID=1288291 RepID=A0A059F0E8_9MICR|nr:hypothetical protein H312_01951 [Anncaliia algerae PRA339]